MRIFLAGRIDGLTDREANGWRKKFTKEILPLPYVKVYNPALDVSGFVKGKVADLCNNRSKAPEILDRNDRELKKANLIVVKIDDVYGIGTLMDLGAAHILKIPIYGFGGIDALRASFALEYYVDEFFPDVETLIKKLKQEIQDKEYTIKWF